MEFFHLILIQRDKQEAISIITPRQGSALKVAKKKTYSDHLNRLPVPKFLGGGDWFPGGSPLAQTLPLCSQVH